MGDRSAIEWTDATWNPVTGCTKVSPGCRICYAEVFAERFRGVPGHPQERGFDPRVVPKMLDQPRRWTRPRSIFVNSMSDLFHDAFADVVIADVFHVMRECPQHTFQVLTKRSRRMRHWVPAWLSGLGIEPLPNVILGVSVESDRYAKERLPDLVATPAARRMVSCEPLLGDIPSLVPFLPELDWVIVGGESGVGAKPMHPDWPRRVRDACNSSGVPFHFKQWGNCAPATADGPWTGFVSARDGKTSTFGTGVEVKTEGYGVHSVEARDDMARFRRFAHKRDAGRLLDRLAHDAGPRPLGGLP